MNTEKTIELLKKYDLHRMIDEPLDIYLEIPHIAYIEVKKPDSKALLFTNPIDKENDKTFDTPVLMNVFCSPKAVELLIGDANRIADEIESLLKMKPLEGFIGKIDMFKTLFNLKYVPPKRLKYKGACQEVIKLGSDND
jgi:4-hydroxy-3-polyprenylbenzoate decarboxylase